MRILELTLTDYPVSPSYGRRVFRVTQVLHRDLLEHMTKEDFSGIFNEMNRQLDRDIANFTVAPNERPDYDERTLPQAKP